MWSQLPRDHSHEHLTGLSLIRALEPVKIHRIEWPHRCRSSVDPLLEITKSVANILVLLQCRALYKLVAHLPSRDASLLLRLVEGEERWEAPDHLHGVLQNWGETELNHSDTCMVLKAMTNNRRHSALCHDEFRGP
ncbi:uncharacterized protein TNCV_3503541 [Trichonephila clavipes]|uniref:Uncharacterized protein n=1 Tax=Trichonephila clavipes TaxID=2585209 RepID=A0A8X6S0A6_TRICX|nr:uncharacterized protein TNCV_3503541 [Trichonephila clavipes]